MSEHADTCDWSKLRKLNGEHWSRLLQEQPQFADRCDRGKLGSRLVGILKEHPEFISMFLAN